MNFDDLEREALNENLLKTLIKLSKVDGEIAENEMMYILKAGLAMGIPQENIVPLWKEEYTGLVIPTSEQDRMNIMYYLIFVIESDKKVSQKEEELAYHYGLKLGFNHLMDICHNFSIQKNIYSIYKLLNKLDVNIALII